MPVYVIGHKNPDTDAICSAIAYADLLQKTTRPDALPACCGTVNQRTRFVLERAAVPPPRLLVDVRPTARDICRTDIVAAHENEPFFDVYTRMQKHEIRSIPLLAEDESLAGMVSLHHLLELLLPEPDASRSTRRVYTSLACISRVLGGSYQHVVNEQEAEELSVMVGAMSASGFTERMHKTPAHQLIIVAGDRPTVQVPAIEYGVRALVVTGGYRVSEGLLELARSRNVSVINSQFDTAMTTTMIRSARLITDAVASKPVSFTEHELVKNIALRVRDVHDPLFPVLDDRGTVMGVFSKSDLLVPPRTSLILVDHNEYGQAVRGAEDANILEVIDHHRLGGGLRSREPIRFFNEPVGSTSSIVARMFRDKDVPLSPGIALCLAGGIISDTLKLSSPTTTEFDRDILDWVSGHCEQDVDEFAQAFFSAGSALQLHTPDVAITEDCKTFEENGWEIAVSQVEEVGLQHFWAQKDDLSAALVAMCESRQLDFCCLLVTDITKNNSLMLTAGSERLNEAIEFPQLEHNLFELNQVVSRKKQLLPHLMWLLARFQPEEAKD